MHFMYQQEFMYGPQLFRIVSFPIIERMQSRLLSSVAHRNGQQKRNILCLRIICIIHFNKTPYFGIPFRHA